jgi:hypothetical protein
MIVFYFYRREGGASSTYVGETMETVSDDGNKYNVACMNTLVWMMNENHMYIKNQKPK